MKKYVYFVSYIYADNSTGLTQYGNCEVIRTKKITSSDDIVDVGESIKNSGDYKHAPAIINFTLLRNER